MVKDHGSGMLDVDKTMTDGFGTANGLGAGLQSTKRLVQMIGLESEAGQTKITIIVRREL